MWAWLTSPRASTATATAVAVVLALFWLAPWTKPLPHVPGLPLLSDGAAPPPVAVPPGGEGAPAPADTGRKAPPPQRPADAAPVSAPAPGEGVAAAGGTSSSGPAAPVSVAKAEPAPPMPGAATPPTLPSFDVVRVEPTGATVIAGRGAPGSTVTLLDGRRVVATARVDEGGQFVLLPPDLPEGSHDLTLQAAGADGAAPLASRQSVAVVVGGNGATRPLVALLSPDAPARVLSDGSPVAPPAAGTQQVAVAIQAVEAAPGGRFSASGVAKAGSQSRLYLNGAFLADVTADHNGRWAVEVQKGMRPGQYVVRADELAPGTGKVVHRAEVPFTYPAVVAEDGRRQLLGAGPPPASPGAVAAPSSPGAMAAAGGVARNDVATPRGIGGPSAAAPAPTAADAASPPALAATGPAGEKAVAVAGAEVGTSSAAAPAPVAATVVSDLRTAMVVRGDTLWGISRKMLGRGIHYTQIYASNTGQIRDPARIYPGQVFVVPQKPAD